MNARKKISIFVAMLLVSISISYTCSYAWPFYDSSTHTVYFDAAGGSVYPQSMQVQDGNGVPYFPTPSREGYRFLFWTNEGAASYNVKYDITCTALWEPYTYQIGFEPNGGFCTSTGMTIQYGQRIGYLPYPTRTGYTFTGWNTSPKGYGETITSSTYYYWTSWLTLYAQWAPNTYRVYFDGNGGIPESYSTTVTYDSYYGYLPGASRTGYTFNGWCTSPSGYGEYISSMSRVYITYDQTLYASWMGSYYQLYYDAQGGSVSRASDTIQYNSTYGARLVNGAFPIPTRDNYIFKGWFTSPGGKGKQISTSTVVTTPSNQTVYAYWIPAASTITATAGSGGCISPEGTSTYYLGTNATYSITPNNGYGVADVVVDGVSQGAVSSYTFSNIQTNHSISATFYLKPATFTATAGPGGYISPSGTTYVAYGNSQTYYVTPYDGFTIADVTVNGKSIGAVTSFTVTADSDKTIYASFKSTAGASISSAILGGLDYNGKTKTGYGITAAVYLDTFLATVTSVRADFWNCAYLYLEYVQSDNAWEFPKNASSPYQYRKYYIPIDTADGTYSVTFTAMATDNNTGSQIKMPSITKSFSICGTMYDDRA